MDELNTDIDLILNTIEDSMKNNDLQKIEPDKQHFKRLIKETYQNTRLNKLLNRVKNIKSVSPTRTFIFKDQNKRINFEEISYEECGLDKNDILLYKEEYTSETCCEISAFSPGETGFHSKELYYNGERFVYWETKLFVNEKKEWDIKEEFTKINCSEFLFNPSLLDTIINKFQSPTPQKYQKTLQNSVERIYRALIL
jgi:hypothetical protein